MGFAELGQFTIDPGSVRLLPEAFSRKNLVVILDVVDQVDRHARDVNWYTASRF